MKKYIAILGITLGLSNVQAQNIEELMRYTQTEPLGTARFRALSGAFGAVGGDLSAISLNPASSSIFNNNQLAVTTSIYGSTNRTNYFGSTSEERLNDFDLNQLGGVLVFKTKKSGAKVNKFALAVNYEKQNNFNDAVSVKGVNPNNSIANYFLHHANKNGGVSAFDIDSFYYSHVFDANQNAYVEDYGFLANYFNTSEYAISNNLAPYIYQYLGETGGAFSFNDQQAFLGFESFIIDVADNYNDSNNRVYKSLVAEGGNYHQEHSIISSGYNGKLTVNGSISLHDRLIIGVNLNSHFSDFTRNSKFFERNNNPLSVNDRVKRIYFDNDTHTFGNGFSLQLGTILKVNKFLRLGASYESPTWHKLADEISQKLTVVSGNNLRELQPDVVNPNLTLVFEPYRIRTADKLNLSGALIFGKRGFLNIDYGWKFYERMQLRPEDEFEEQNSSIGNTFVNSKQLAVGGECKIERWSLRGGYRYETSPYIKKSLMSDLKGYSLGLGYNFGGTKVDIAYSTTSREVAKPIFDAGLIDNFTKNLRSNNLTATLSFEL
ncbi:OmpP1/FadL family transporter [Flavobacterium sp.]|uniref:OmpP1/FadL family transporter n=1 Tax=Flavobacterium sp. TaxID=239 RepID=UPI003D0F8113